MKYIGFAAYTYDGIISLVFIAREFLFELKAEQAQNQKQNWPMPYEYAVKRNI